MNKIKDEIKKYKIFGIVCVFFAIKNYIIFSFDIVHNKDVMIFIWLGTAIVWSCMSIMHFLGAMLIKIFKDD